MAGIATVWNQNVQSVFLYGYQISLENVQGLVNTIDLETRGESDQIFLQVLNWEGIEVK